MKYFYIDNIKFNYNLEFDNSNVKNNWKFNAPLIEYCETLGILIPHYCYHKNLSIAGNCRMCLIELKKSPKPIVSCAMTAKSVLASNSVIYTNSPLIKKARENILEFLLLNHPLDCPICDQGGECDLQDQSLFFGVTKKRFYNYRRVVTNKNIGPIIKTVMTRCIHCTRCVRFANEIAGIEDLGIFGRGVHSEIGTYVTKLFNSELSGNIADLCPVGALTLKPYAFVYRSWELKTVYSIDVSDGFGTNIQILVKKNKIIKILPAYDNSYNEENWISDKTRFLFDGMFSYNRKLTKELVSGSNSFVNLDSWNVFFRNFVYLIYFYDHLNKYFLETNNIIFVFDENISLEVLNLLLIVNKKFEFFKLRRLKQFNITSDFESEFQLNPIINESYLNKADVCLLIGIDPRFDSSYLNLKLRKRFFKGNFKIFKLGSKNELTFSTTSVGTNINTLKSITEGTHIINQNLNEANNLMILCNINIYKRKDSYVIQNFIRDLSIKTSLKTKTWNGINVLHNSINSVGTHLLNNFKGLSKNDFFGSNVLYFINTEFSYLNVFIQLKLLNVYQTLSCPKTIIKQNAKTDETFDQVSKNVLNVHNLIDLPSNVFFESSGTYYNTEGILKKSIKVISSNKNVKDIWQILRKINIITKNVAFMSNFSSNDLIQFNCTKMINFKSFTNFIYLNVLNLSTWKFFVTSNFNQKFGLINSKFCSKKLLLNSTPIKKQVNDFFIGGFDNYSKQSTTMLDCSYAIKLKKTNF